ncbi:phage tail tape measure C-terminal domain-containing protein [Rhodoferax sp. GW822-FHT02A01]|uniref:phage tail tape measure C-terminal domain-containing protein n=1 Tax=Rhodoferax sp. GW822-FHT02A01 TaxID=3141537 RepID=UPI00315D78C9
MNIGTLTIEMAANVARLQKDMSDAKSVVTDSMKQIKEQVSYAQDAIFKLTAAFTGIASADKFKEIIMGSIESVAKLHELSTQAGITVEALSGLAAVGKATGTGADTIAAASNKLSKALASANEDSKGAATALKALGLSFDEFQHMSPDERIQKVAVALDGFQDGAQKSAAAMFLFGKSGAEMLPFLKDLAQTGELHAKVTTEQAEAAHQFEVELGVLKTRGDAWKKSLALELLPTLVDITEAMLDIKKSTADVGSTLGEGFKAVLQTVAVLGVNIVYVFKQIANETGGIAAQLVAFAHLDFHGAGVIGDAMKDDAKKAREEVDKLSSSLLGLTNSKAGAGRGGNAFTDPRSLGTDGGKMQITGLAGDGRGTKEIDEGIQLLNSLKTKYEQLTGSVSEYAQVLRQVDAFKNPVSDARRKEILDLALAIQKETEAQKSKKDLIAYDVEQANKQAAQNKILEDYVTAGNDARAAIIAQTDALGLDSDELTRHNAMLQVDALMKKAMVGATVETRQELEKLAATMKGGMSDALDAMKAKQEALNGSWQYGAKNALDAYQKNVANIAASTQNLFTNAFKGMEDALVNFVKTGKLDFSTLADSIISDLVRIQVQQSITGPLAKALGGSSGGVEVSNGGFLDSALKLFGFANGGQPPVGVPSIVGERGPELFIPNTPGTIVPNHALGGGQSINYAPVIHIDARTDQAEVYANVQSALQKNNEAFAQMLRQQGVLQ